MASADETNKQGFEDNEKCWAKDSNEIYQANIRKSMHVPPSNSSSSSSDPEISEWRYFVHYQGWNVRWDKWLPETDLLKDTEETRTMVKVLKERKKLDKNNKLNSKMQMDDVCEAKSKVVKFLTEKEKKAQQEVNRKRQKAELDLTSIQRAKYLKVNNLIENSSVIGMTDGSRGFKIMLPFVLKKILVDDWEAINGGDVNTFQSNTSTGNNVAMKELRKKREEGMMVFELPVKVSVKDIFEMFIKEREVKEKSSVGEGEESTSSSSSLSSSSSSFSSSSSSSSSSEASKTLTKWRALLHGLSQYFEKSLPLLLLYKSERTQYHTITTSTSPTFTKKSLCEIYGVEHLLRMLVKLPSIVNMSEVSESEGKQLLFRIGEIVKFLGKNLEAVKRGKRYVKLKAEVKGDGGGGESGEGIEVE